MTLIQCLRNGNKVGKVSFRVIIEQKIITRNPLRYIHYQSIK